MDDIQTIADTPPAHHRGAPPREDTVITMTATTIHHLPTQPGTAMQQHVLDRVASGLARRFDGAVPAATVRATVADVAAELQAEARITTYLPALAERAARRRLEELRGTPASVTITRAQLAAA